MAPWLCARSASPSHYEPRTDLDLCNRAKRISGRQIHQRLSRVTVREMADAFARRANEDADGRAFRRPSGVRRGAVHWWTTAELSKGPVWTRLCLPVETRGLQTSARTGDDAARGGAHLVAAVAAHRDQAAFAALFDYYSPRLKGHLLARGATSATAEEIVQDVMLAVWHKAEQFDATRGSVSAWVFALARNAFIDRVRREHRPVVDPNDPLLAAGSAAADTERLLLESEDQRQLAAALRSLPTEQQHVVQRSFFHGESLAQISAAGGLPLGTVKTRARLALSRLRSLVGKAGQP